jgi:hypothetical protein
VIRTQGSEQSVINLLPNTRKQQDPIRAKGTKNQQDSKPASTSPETAPKD